MTIAVYIMENKRDVGGLVRAFRDKIKGFIEKFVTNTMEAGHH